MYSTQLRIQQIYGTALQTTWQNFTNYIAKKGFSYHNTWLGVQGCKFIFILVISFCWLHYKKFPTSSAVFDDFRVAAGTENVSTCTQLAN